MKLFVDTGAFMALIDADDENHKAAAFYRIKFIAADTKGSGRGVERFTSGSLKFKIKG
jgi:hypothetical protein